MEVEILKNIYNNMVDNKSKDIFIKRLLYSITEDKEYVLSVGKEYVSDILKITEIETELKNYEKAGKKIIIFGAGLIGKNLVENMSAKIKIECFVDNHVKGEVLGLKVISPEELKSEYSDEIVIISPVKGNLEMYEQLIALGFNKNNIINFGEAMFDANKTQYFELLSSSDKKESLVDCGCYDGGTSKLFIEWCNGNYSNIWAFEPDNANYERCKSNLNLPNCELYNVGAYNEETIVRFAGGKNGCSNINNIGETEIRTVKLDDVLKDKEVTFIKMDIEGAEFKALQGAEEIIRTQKPRLAICIYHKPEDIISVPGLILQYNPDYKLMIRHYGASLSETVLYAF